MAWLTNDFKCEECGLIYEDTYKRGTESELECPRCGSDQLDRLLSFPNLDTMSAMTPEQRIQIMKKRSTEHTQKQIDAEPERWGEAGFARRTKKIQV